jgi:hypothetical protein
MRRAGRLDGPFAARLPLGLGPYPASAARTLLPTSRDGCVAARPLVSLEMKARGLPGALASECYGRVGTFASATTFMPRRSVPTN